jgi:CRISPR/Cas system-associated exonuclease Cas4 (RecB family)
MGLADISISDVFDLEGEYNTALSAVQKDGSRQGYFHPSGVGSCGRSQVYEYNKAPFIPETDLGSSEIFDLGHAIHELVGRRLQSVKSHLEAKNIGYRLQLEVPFDPKTDILFSDFRIGGTTDARLDVWADDWAQRSVIEIKSINRANFEKLIKPKHEHLMQAHLYAFRYDCPIIYVWYYCKDTSSKRVFTCLFDPDIFNEAIDYFSGLMDHVIQGSLPERNEDFYMCPRCQYRDICNPPVLLKLKSSKQTKTMTNIRTHRKL